MNKTFKLTALILTIAAIVISAAFGVFAAQKVSDISFGDNIYVHGLDDATEQAGMINMLLIGVDEGGYRSDTIMLVSVDGYSGRVNILSVPRDTMIKPEGYTTQKINALIGLGREAADAGKISEPEEMLIDEVKSLTGLPVHYFISVDFDGFKDIIDALDGVDFNVPYDMNYDDPTQNLHIHLKAGMQHLNGQAAHDFVRFRHNNGGSAPGEYVMGDEGREYWQQEFMKELVKQKMKPQYLSKVDDLFKVVKENVRTNYTMKDLLNHLYLVQQIDVDNIGSYQLPGGSQYISDLWWYIYDPDKTRELVNRVFLPMSKEEWEEYKTTHAEELANSALGFSAISEIKK